MAISHICQFCGWDLTRARAVRDPHYGLPLVTCPKCGEHAVRRRHPLVSGYRASCRVVRTFIILLVQSAFALGLLGLTGAYLIGSGMAWNLGAPDSEPMHFWVPYLITGAGIGIVTGLWLSIGLNHIRFSRAAAGWGVAVIIAAAIAASCIGLFGGLADVTDQPYEITESMTWIGPALAFFMPAVTIVMALILLIASTMYPIGVVMLRMHAIGRRAFWRWMRRRRRIRYVT